MTTNTATETRWADDTTEMAWNAMEGEGLAEETWETMESWPWEPDGDRLHAAFENSIESRYPAWISVPMLATVEGADWGQLFDALAERFADES